MRSLRRLRPLLGSLVEISVEAAGCRAEAAIAAAFADIALIHRLLSFHEPDSELSRLNRAGREPVALHPHAMRVLRLARAMTRATGGLFNCTVGGELVRRGVLPDHGGAPALARGGAADIECATRRARLRRPVRVTLDGIAKGYAVDLAVRTLRRHGVAGGWINAGGDLRVFGATVLPVHRREADGRLLPLGGLHKAALASSRVAPHHDPDFPGLIVPGTADAAVQAGVWSVLARHAWRADALTKVAGLTPASRRAARLRSLGGILVGPAPSGEAAA
jgi:thiamine biosynthesis lipoprotein